MYYTTVYGVQHCKRELKSAEHHMQ